MVVGVVTAWFMAHHPKLEILPLVLGILGFTFGSILGVFLVAVLAPRRGSDFGNVLAMSLGIAAVLLLTNPFGLQQNMGIEQPLVLAFPWRITVGTLVTVAVALCFSTPARAQQQDSGNSSLAK
jgi:Na+/proline symporter